MGFKMDNELFMVIGGLLENNVNSIEIKYDGSVKTKDRKDYIEELKEGKNIKGDVRLIDLDMEIYDDIDILEENLNKLYGYKYTFDYGYIGGRF